MNIDTSTLTDKLITLDDKTFKQIKRVIRIYRKANAALYQITTGEVKTAIASKDEVAQLTNILLQLDSRIYKLTMRNAVKMKKTLRIIADLENNCKLIDEMKVTALKYEQSC